MRLWHLKVLVARRTHLEPPEFKLMAYFYRLASNTVDGVVKRPREEIAAATGILPRDIRPLVKELGEAGELEVISLEKNTAVRILAEHWSLPPAPAGSAPPATPAQIKQLMFRMTGKRVTLEDVQELREVSCVDYAGLVQVLDFLLRGGARYDSFRRLAGDVVHQVRAREKPGEYRGTDALRPAFSVLEQPVGKRMDAWLKTLSPTEFKMAVFLFVAAAESPDGVAAHSQKAIAAATRMSERTVSTNLHNLDARRVLQVLSDEKETTLIRFPGCRGLFGLPELIPKPR